MINLENSDSTVVKELLSEASLAKTSALQVNGQDSLDLGQDSFGKSVASSTKPKRSGSSSKTSPVYCHLTTEETWEPLSGRWLSAGMGSHTGFLTLSTLESPKDAVESSLLDVLETTGVHLQKYLLSSKACEGILRRATKRGKSLPALLHSALERGMGAK